MTPEMAFTTVDFPWATCPIVPVPRSRLTIEPQEIGRFDQQTRSIPRLIVAWLAVANQLSFPSHKKFTMDAPVLKLPPARVQ